MANRTRVLIVPGWQGSGEAHWQSIWHREHPEYERLEQRDWLYPDAAEWTETLDRAILSSDRPVVLAAHSLGCLAVALWARRARQGWPVEAALLVAPPDLEGLRNCPASLLSFASAPRVSLPFPSILVASENDPYMTAEAARGLAWDWGSRFVNAGLAGHINVAAGFGPWPEGEQLLVELQDSAESLAERMCA